LPTLGYREKGNIDTPLELAIRNKTDRFSLAIAAIDRIPRLVNKGGMTRDQLRNQQLAAANWAFDNGIDPPHLGNWVWTRDPKTKKKAG